MKPSDMQPHEIARFEDGSAVRHVSPTDPLFADRGTATLALACAIHAARRPAAEALAWFHGTPSSATFTARPVSAGWIELVHERRYAAVRLMDFRAVLAAAYATEFRDESLWLFRPDPIACVPSPGDRGFADVLEPRVKALDEATRTGELGDARESARRKIVLAEVRAAGMLDEPLLERKIEVLEELGYSHLGSLASAARTLGDYYASPERAQYVRHPIPHSIHVAPLSLDWARAVAQPPQGWTLFEWWAACEDTFLGFDGRSGARGRTFLHQGAILAELAWRNEDGSRITLYDVTLRSRSGHSAR